MLSDGDIINLVYSGLINSLLLSAPILGVSLIVGLIVSIIQTTTSIQEQTLTFVPKIIAIFATIMLFSGWLIMTITSYTKSIFIEFIK